MTKQSTNIFFLTNYLFMLAQHIISVLLWCNQKGNGNNKIECIINVKSELMIPKSLNKVESSN